MSGSGDKILIVWRDWLTPDGIKVDAQSFVMFIGLLGTDMVALVEGYKCKWDFLRSLDD